MTSPIVPVVKGSVVLKISVIRPTLLIRSFCGLLYPPFRYLFSTQKRSQQCTVGQKNKTLGTYITLPGGPLSRSSPVRKFQMDGRFITEETQP